MTLPLRSRAAVAITRGVNAVSRRLGVGSGTVIGGRAGLAVDPDLLGRLAAGRQVALVSGTNGKTTTTRLLAVALEHGRGGAGVPASGGARVGAPGRVGQDGRGGAGVPASGGARVGAPGRVGQDGRGGAGVPASGGARVGAPGRARQHGAVVTNATGANMPAGHVAALAAGQPEAPAVLEVDEGYLPGLVRALRPAVVVLLNLSRDQLDRTNEVRMLAGRWRQALAGASETTVVANADDPLVAWGAGAAPRVVWIGAGLGWQLDAVGCPACEGRIDFGGGAGAAGAAGGGGTADEPGTGLERCRGNVAGGEGPGDGWSCPCGFARPSVDVQVVGRAPDDGAGRGHGAGGGAGLVGDAGATTREGVAGGRTEAVWADGRRAAVALRIPGRFNQGNAVMAAAAAEALGVPAERALTAMVTVGEVGGRFTVRRIGGVPTRLLLAKNPAGWHELLGLVCPGRSPVVVGINARVADGRDPSWLWDVPFEMLQGRPVVATGERCLDLAVRLRYAGVPHRTVRDPKAAVALAGRAAAAGGEGNGGAAEVEFIGNYTAFHDLLGGR